jgi:acetylglutamate kinase
MEPKKPIVIKIGGSTLGEHDTTVLDLVELQKRGDPVVVVHGGGKVITDWQEKLGIRANFVRGKRVTDKPSLDVAVSVLAGLVNKELTASINLAGGRAVGICGVDGALIEGSIENAELGYVGKIERINTGVVTVLMDGCYIPVVAPIGLLKSGNESAVHTLNINADTVAGELAAVLKATMLVFLTDVEAVRDSAGKPISSLDRVSAAALVKSGVAAGGMIPKLEACLRSLQGGATAHIIDGRREHALIGLVDGRGEGTVIK